MGKLSKLHKQSARDQAIELARQGHPPSGICLMMGIDYRTLQHWRKNNEEFSAAFEEGLEAAHEDILRGAVQSVRGELLSYLYKDGPPPHPSRFLAALRAADARYRNAQKETQTGESAAEVIRRINDEDEDPEATPEDGTSEA